MPVHDWTRVDDGVFHDLHLGWIAELRRTLNGGVLPPGYYSMVEQPLGGGRVVRAEREAFTRLQRQLVIHNRSGHEVVAIIELVSAGNKSSQHAWSTFLNKALAALHRGIHVLILDLHPPTPRDPAGLHGSLWGRLTGEPYTPPPDTDRTLAAYSAGVVKTAYVEPVAVGSALPDMPLFLTPDGEGHVMVPLEATYQAAYAPSDQFCRDILEAPAAT